MKKPILAVAVATILFTISLVPLAHADFISAGGDTCQSDSNGDQTWIMGYDYPRNNGSINSYVWCPLNMGRSTLDAPVTTLIVRYVDGHTTKPFYCQWHKMTYSGSHYQSAKKYTASVAGGIVDPTSASIGRNYLSWQGSELGGITTIRVDDHVTAFCLVPQPQGSNTSGVHSYYAVW
jgi:hypothetical protein